MENEQAYQRGGLAWRYRLGSSGKKWSSNPKSDETTLGKVQSKKHFWPESLVTLTLNGLQLYTVTNWETAQVGLNTASTTYD